jgi:hypothetical protein
MRIPLRIFASFVVLAGSALAGSPGPDNYLVYSGKAVTTVIHTPVGSFGVQAADNGGSGAIGAISQVLQGKHKGKLAFHGTLHGAADPDPNGVGWGLVKKAPKFGGILDHTTITAAGVQGAAAATFLIGIECDSHTAILSEIDAAIAGLGVVLTQVQYSVAHGYTPKGPGNKHLKEIAALMKALVAYKALLVGSGDGTQQTFADIVKQIKKQKKLAKKVKKYFAHLLKGLEQCGLLQ